MFYDLMKKIYMFDPIKRYSAYKGYKCNAGRVSKNTVSQASGEFNFGEANRRVTSQIGEFADVYCVAKGKKPLAALDYSVPSQIRMKRNLNTNLINSVIRYANYNNVKALHNTGNGRHYLKTVFFKQKKLQKCAKVDGYYMDKR